MCCTPPQSNLATVFMAVPSGMVTALAVQSTAIVAEAQGDDEDEDDHAGGIEGEQQAATLQVRLANFQIVV
jgi:hypothetical protein